MRAHLRRALYREYGEDLAAMYSISPMIPWWVLPVIVIVGGLLIWLAPRV